ncbi:uncharacterized protein LOC144437711 [Glandiceps talaboti]
MPSNSEFSLNILVGDVQVPEYQKDGITYVESNLFTPVSYKVRTDEVVAGEIESQEWPVTPYQIKITANSMSSERYFKVFVDGSPVAGSSGTTLRGGQSKVIKGFSDGSQVKEFLFSLPRFPRDENDHITDKAAALNIGLIEVQCWSFSLSHSGWKNKQTIDHRQANKKDCHVVTRGKYVMMTTKVGRDISNTVQNHHPYARRDGKEKVNFVNTHMMTSKLRVKYIMGPTLQNMGIQLQPLHFRSSTTGASSSRTSIKSQ